MPAALSEHAGAAALDESLKTAGVEQVEPQKLLGELVASTRRLDEILQGMCLSRAQPDNQHDAPTSSTDVKRDKPVAESFVALREMLELSKDRAVFIDIPSISHFNKDLRSDSEEAVNDESRWSRFSSSTKLTFASSSRSPTMTTIASGFSHDMVESILCQELAACDHLLPTQLVKSLARRGLRHLEWHANFLERGIRLALGDDPFRDRTSTSKGESNNQDESASWWLENNRECQVLIEESGHAEDWGILITMEVCASLSNASIEESSNDDEIYVTAKVLHEVFLPKSDYEMASEEIVDELIASACKLEMRLDTKDASKAPKNCTTQDGLNDKLMHGMGVTGPNQLRVSHEQQDRVLPDTINVMVSGSIARDLIQSSDDNCSSSSKAFAQFDVPSTLSRRNRIVQAACGRLHYLFLNDLGMIFACGDATHGAVGVSTAKGISVDYISTPTLVEYFVDRLQVVVQVACGGDSFTGAHSAAITTDGNLYTWGAGVGLGIRSLRSVSEPQLVRFPDDIEGTSSVKVKSVSCGCGFAVAISTNNGVAYSWGKYSDGRLGLGRIPILEKNSRRHGGYKQLQAFQLSPKQLTVPIQHLAGTENNTPITDPPTFTKIVCGDAHCIAITATGQLVSWGRGESGQLGLGSINDVLAPTAVVVPPPGLQWIDIAAGGDWSMALDAAGNIWSWGACGSGSLGRENTQKSTDSSMLTSTLLVSQKELDDREQRRLTEAGLPIADMAETTVPRFLWMTPQMMPAFSTRDIEITSISAGVRHGVALSRSGNLYAWGDRDGTPRLVASSSTTSIAYATCGGHSIVALRSNQGSLNRDFLRLYQQCMRLSSLLESNSWTSTGNESTELAGADVALLVSGRRLLAHRFILAQRSFALRQILLDQLVLADGSSLRSTSGFPVPEVLVPSLRIDVARVVLEFIYTDAVALPSLLLRNKDTQKDSQVSIYLARDILRAAKELGLPGLERICQLQLLPLLSPSETLADSVQKEVAGKITGEADTQTLSKSLKGAYRNPSWSDLTLLAEGRMIQVHKCVVEARSIAFRRLLSSSPTISTIKVEDTYRCMIRVLAFIYSDDVPRSTLLPVKKYATETDKADESRPPQESTQPDNEDRLAEVLEDLVAADKYGLERMKREIELAVSVTATNCWRVLAAAEQAHASQLKVAAIGFATRNLPQVVFLQKSAIGSDESHLEFEAFSKQYPALVGELFAQLQEADDQQKLLVDWKASLTKRVTKEQEAQEREWADKRATARFPWLALTLTVTFGALFLALMNMHEIRYHPVVPALNLVAMAALIASIALGWLEKI